MVFWRTVGDAIAVAVKIQPRSRHPGLHRPNMRETGLREAGLKHLQPRDATRRGPERHNQAAHGGSPDGDDERLTIAVREPPRDGRANRAACAALAAAVGVPPSYVEVASGAASRRKTLLVSGDAASIAARLAAL